MLLKSNNDNQIAMYDFAIDGGAVGVYSTGLVIPAFNLTYGMWFCQTELFTSAGGLATVAIGWRSLSFSPVLTFPNEYLAPVLATAVPVSVPFQGVHTTANPDRVNIPIELIFSIGVEPLTAGRLLIYTTYLNSDL